MTSVITFASVFYTQPRITQNPLLRQQLAHKSLLNDMPSQTPLLNPMPAQAHFDGQAAPTRSVVYDGSQQASVVAQQQALSSVLDAFSSPSSNLTRQQLVTYSYDTVTGAGTHSSCCCCCCCTLDVGRCLCGWQLVSMLSVSS